MLSKKIHRLLCVARDNDVPVQDIEISLDTNDLLLDELFSSDNGFNLSNQLVHDESENLILELFKERVVILPVIGEYYRINYVGASDAHPEDFKEEGKT